MRVGTCVYLWLNHADVGQKPKQHCKAIILKTKFSSVQSLSCVQLSETPWTTAHQASLSITISQSLPKPMSIESVIPSNHLILCHPLLLLPSIFPSIRVFSNESVLHTPFPIWNQSLVPCLVLTVASWSAYRCLRRQLRWSGIPISWRICHSLLWSTWSKCWRSQWSRGSCFSGTLLLFLWSNGCWQFDLWFLCLF